MFALLECSNSYYIGSVQWGKSNQSALWRQNISCYIIDVRGARTSTGVPGGFRNHRGRRTTQPKEQRCYVTIDERMCIVTIDEQINVKATLSIH